MPRGFRFLLLLLALALGHTMLTISLTAIVFGSGMARFDTGAPAPTGVRLLNGLATVLAYPVLPLVTRLPLTMRPQGFPGEHLVFLANSVIWAIGIIAVRRRVNVSKARSARSG